MYVAITRAKNNLLITYTGELTHVFPENNNLYRSSVLEAGNGANKEKYHVKTFNGSLTTADGSKYFSDGQGGYYIEEPNGEMHSIGMLTGFIATPDGLKYYPDSKGGFIVKSLDNKESRISSFIDVIAIDGLKYTDYGMEGLLVETPDGEMHSIGSLFNGFLTAADGSKYYPDFHGEFDVELPSPKPTVELPHRGAFRFEVKNPFDYELPF